MMSNISRLGFWTVLLDTLFPMSCLGCGRGLKGYHAVSYCRTCRQDIRFIQSPFCSICGKPFGSSGGENHICGYCLRHHWHFQQARAVVWYRQPVTEAVKIFKYRGKMHVLATFTALTNHYLAHEAIAVPDVLIPVPLHVKRLRRRGFNQSLILCRRLFPAWQGKIEPHVLERHRWTNPQTGLSGSERRRNVRRAFRVRRPEKIKNKIILLVDDVFTTGTTVNECARVLRKNKAATVNVFTFARVVNQVDYVM